MRPDEDVEMVFQLHQAGLSPAAIARQVGISRSTVCDWLVHGKATVLARPMRRARTHPPGIGPCPLITGLDEPAFSYVLGQYLGDGCVSKVGRSYRLRIACCDAYPGIMAETAEMVERTVPGHKIGFTQGSGCTEVYATSLHWPCLLPHGPGRKHLRVIRLAGWQREIALDRYPDRLVRGLIHSDGCRCINRVRQNGRVYEYPRYLFANRSEDILAMFLEACGRLGIDARPNKAWSISVARRASVEKLDRIVGPKS